MEAAGMDNHPSVINVLRDNVVAENINGVVTCLAGIGRGDLQAHFILMPPSNGDTCIHMACRNRGSAQILTTLLNLLTTEQKAYVLCLQNSSGKTPYHYAAEFGLLEHMRVLYSHTPQQCLNHVFFIRERHNNANVLQCCIIKGSMDKIEFLRSILTRDEWLSGLMQLNTSNKNVIQAALYHQCEDSFFESFFSTLDANCLKALLEYVNESGYNVMMSAVDSKFTSQRMIQQLYGRLERCSSNPLSHIISDNLNIHCALSKVFTNKQVSGNRIGCDIFQYLWSKVPFAYKKAVCLSETSHSLIWPNLPYSSSVAVNYLQIVTRGLREHEVVPLILLPRRNHNENLVCIAANHAFNASLLRYLLSRLGSKENIFAAISGRSGNFPNLLSAVLDRRHPKKEIIRILLDSGVAPEGMDFLIQATSHQYQTGLHTAIRNGNDMDTITTLMNRLTPMGRRRLLQIGCDVGQTPIDEALRCGRNDVAAYLRSL